MLLVHGLLGNLERSTDREIMIHKDSKFFLFEWLGFQIFLSLSYSSYIHGIVWLNDKLLMEHRKKKNFSWRIWLSGYFN